jgi:hypothetical protein
MKNALTFSKNMKNVKQSLELVGSYKKFIPNFVKKQQ